MSEFISPSREYPHAVEVPSTDEADFDRVRDWLAEQGLTQGSHLFADDGDWCIQLRRGSIGEIIADTFRFKKVTHAVHFKLRWWDELHTG